MTRPGMKDTPARMARAYAELFSPRPFRATHFPMGPSLPVVLDTE